MYYFTFFVNTFLSYLLCQVIYPLSSEYFDLYGDKGLIINLFNTNITFYR